MQPPLHPPNGRPYRPVATLNGWTLPWRMRNGVKEFHLVGEPVIREGERVCIRVGNLTMTNHPIHLHGHEFVVTGTDGGWAHAGPK